MRFLYTSQPCNRIVFSNIENVTMEWVTKPFRLHLFFLLLRILIEDWMEREGDR